MPNPNIDLSQRLGTTIGQCTVMHTIYVLHPVCAQMTEQNPTEQLMKLLGFVHVPETKTSGRESLSSSAVTWLA